KIAAIIRASLTPLNNAKAGKGTRPGLRVGSRPGPGRNVIRTFRWRHWFVGIQNGKGSARAGFIVAVGVMVVVSQAARNATPKKPMISFMIKMETAPSTLLSLPFSNRIWQGSVPLAPRLDG